MIQKIQDWFNLTGETENHQEVIEKISRDSIFKGTNLWLLVFAIFIASLGLNINSPSVIIGAMLISPLMGPIIGIGLGLAVNDLQLVKKAVRNFTYAIIVSLLTSTLYFTLTPLNDAFSELLARTTPTIWDVLIALFGGLAGMLANSSKLKGNVLPGVAIATALMPPLCTAGYGLATFQLSFFFGALYLFTINTVFIALATFLTVKFLKYPQKHFEDRLVEKRSHRIIYGITLLTIIPSIYFGYEMIQQHTFQKNANTFLQAYSSVGEAYLINSEVDTQNRKIKMIYGGTELDPAQIESIKSQMKFYKLENTSLSIQQGFSFLNKQNDNHKLTSLINEKDKIIYNQKVILDSLFGKKKRVQQIFSEAKVFAPEIKSIVINPDVASNDTVLSSQYLALIEVKNSMPFSKKSQIENWLRIRLNSPKLRVVIYN